MTIEEYLTERLTRHGLSSADAEQVVAKVKAGDGMDEMAQRWGKDLDTLNRTARHELWVRASALALALLEENKPNHWAIACFKPGVGVGLG